MAHPKAKAAPGDKVFVGGSASDRKVFISDIIACIEAKGAKTLLITISDLSEFLHAQPALSPSNLFRKQYGNLEHVFQVEHLPELFLIDKSVIRLQPMAKLQTALDKKYLSQDLLDKCAQMHTFKRKHDLTTWKSLGKNECSRCQDSYSVIANSAKACDGQNHQPAFDFDKNEDVLLCGL